MGNGNHLRFVHMNTENWSMKPLQIGLLVAAGALGGAMVMKWQAARHPNVSAVAASSPVAAVPAPAPVPEPAAVDQPVPEPPAKPELAVKAEAPSPFPEKNRIKEARQRAA